jgi:hypothetical protein
LPLDGSHCLTKRSYWDNFKKGSGGFAVWQIEDIDSSNPMRQYISQSRWNTTGVNYVHKEGSACFYFFLQDGDLFYIT